MVKIIDKGKVNLAYKKDFLEKLILRYWNVGSIKNPDKSKPQIIGLYNGVSYIARINIKKGKIKANIDNPSVRVHHDDLIRLAESCEDKFKDKEWTVKYPRSKK